ncbi:MAG: energy transducer TonB [Aquabacterium sp.]
MSALSRWWKFGALSLTAHLVFVGLIWQESVNYGELPRPTSTPSIHAPVLVLPSQPQPTIQTPERLSQTTKPTVQRTPPQSIETTSAPPPLVPPTHGEADTSFIPRPLLTVPPAPQSTIVMPPVVDPAFVGKHVGILALYIDETGRVHHIRALEPRLPPELEKTAMAAFQGMHYTPGQKNGTIVKSRIKVEVVFENAPVTAPVPLQ